MLITQWDRENLALTDDQSENGGIDSPKARTGAPVRGRLSVDGARDVELMATRPRQALRDDLAQAVVEEPRRIPVYADERRRGTRRGTRHEMLQQPLALLVGQSGPPQPHHTA